MISEPNWGPDGLVPVVVRDEADGRVLMVAYADAEALAATEATEVLHFHSRSRGTLWRKGETSGNTLHVVDLALDCDGDAILATVRPAGPACHRGTRSCFDPEDTEDTEAAQAAQDAEAAAQPALPPPTEGATASQGFAWLEPLWQTIEDRRDRRPTGSYTVSLIDSGVDAVGRKVTEEATEVLIAAKDDAAAEAAGADRTPTRAALAGEAADLIYHALVLLAERGVPPAAPLEVLRSRHAG